MRNLRRLTRAGIVTALLTTAFHVTPPPAHAGGGGCLPKTMNGWSASACSSDNGVRVSGDLYLDVVGGYGGECEIYYDLWDDTSHRIVAHAGPQGCYLGRHPEIHATKVPGHIYWTAAEIRMNDVPVWWGTSFITY
jgi:hypothetical protein